MGSCDHTVLVEELLNSELVISAKVSNGFDKPLYLSPQLVPFELSKDCMIDSFRECKDVVLEKKFCSESEKKSADFVVSISKADPSDTMNGVGELKDEGDNIDYLEVRKESHNQSEEGGSCFYDDLVKSEGVCLEDKSLMDVAKTPLNLSSIFSSLHPCDEPVDQKDIMIAGPSVRCIKEENDSNSINAFSEQNLLEPIEKKCDVINTSSQVFPSLPLEKKGEEAVLVKREFDGCSNILLSHCDSVQKTQSKDIHGDNISSYVRVVETKEEKYNVVNGVEIDAYTNSYTIDKKISNSNEDIDDYDTVLGTNSFENLCQSSRAIHKSRSKREATREKVVKKGRKTSNKVPHHHKTIEFLSNVSRRKRSCFSKPARSSIWGVLGNVSDLFEHNKQLAINKVCKKGSHISKGEGKNRPNANEKTDISMGLNGKGNVAGNRIRLKIKFGNKVNPSNDVGNIFGISTMLDGEVKGLVKPVEDKGYLDPEPSPESEVINQILDSQVGLKVQKYSSCDLVPPEDDGKCLKTTQMRSKKGKKKGKNSGSEENHLSTNIDHRLGSVQYEHFETFSTSSKLKNDKKSKCVKPGRGTLKKSVSKSKVKENGVSDKIICEVDIDKEMDHNIGGTNMDDVATLEDEGKMDMVTNGKTDPILPLRNAWVSCDECQKWRRIAATLADSIEETNSKWTCKDNMDKSFSDCSIPQEMSDAEINVELNISDEEDASGTHYNSLGNDRRPLPVPEPSSWTLIKSNLYLHRKRRKQTIDEVMVCHCKPSINGRSGCGDECLNRMLNIECVQGTCPCGDRCSNQQFQKHKYAKLNCFRCGKKGYGLQLLEDISNGQFLIEYVGEVLDLHAYEARQVEYASRGHKHFYFMTLDGSEVIDACAKGNLGRFINHSCDPNCRTEKWMVNGEICIGLFAIKDIKKGEELTFDYNYVRVFGAAAKKCACGSIKCRGYIGGGDPLGSELIVQGDSDDEFPEPVMLLEGLDSKSIQIEDLSEGGNKVEESAGPVVKLEITTENKNVTELSVSVAPHTQIPEEIVGPISIQQVESPIQNADAESKPVSNVHQSITTEHGAIDQSTKSISLDNHVANKKSQIEEIEENRVSSKFQSIAKSSTLSIIIKKGKLKSNVVGIKKAPVMPYYKPKKVPPGSDDSRYEALVAKLNELLDADGGISKRNDSSKGYLKLLLLTAASGDRGNGGAIQSNRELSLILDAILKTKSRMVLVDIINKNGLRMLHNIMKQSRSHYNQTPVLRKLLKIIEYLAGKEILTLEHINGGPPCPGMESFKDSILTLTEHNNKQVHQIARNFRDKWIPRPSRKFGCAERDNGRMGSNCNQFSSPKLHKHEHQPNVASPPVVTATTEDQQHTSLRGSKIRKRKSRWDEPAVQNSDTIPPQSKQQKVEPSRLVHDHENACDTMNIDVPPGFSHPLENSIDRYENKVGPTKSPSEMVTAHPQKRFTSYLPVSYGIPLPTMQQIGTPVDKSLNNWKIAPGITFYPYPPLPPNPRPKSFVNHDGQSQHTSCSSTSGVQPINVNAGRTNNHHMLKRDRGYSNDLGMRFRQQKWNNNNLTPQWCHNGNVGPHSSTNQQTQTYYSENNCNNTFYQHQNRNFLR